MPRNSMLLIIIAVVCGFLVTAPAFAQPITAEHAEQYRVIQTPNGIERLLLGNVHIRIGALEIFADSVREQPTRALIILQGNVRIYRDSLHIAAPILYYNQKTQTMDAPKGVTIVDSAVRVTAQSGIYFRPNDHIQLSGSVHIATDSLLLLAEVVHYWRRSQKFRATGNVQLLRQPDRFLIADSVSGDLATDCYTASGNVQAWSFSSSSADTTFLQAASLYLCADTLRAKESVVVVTDQFRCRTGTLFQIDSTLLLFPETRIWLDSTVLQADSVVYRQLNDSTDQLTAWRNASVLLPASVQFPDRWHLLKSEYLRITTIKDAPAMILAHTDAYSRYFLFDESQQPAGVVEHKADTITIAFQHKKPVIVAHLHKVYGQFLPESLIDTHPQLLESASPLRSMPSRPSPASLLRGFLSQFQRAPFHVAQHP